MKIKFYEKADGGVSLQEMVLFVAASLENFNLLI